MGTKWKILLLLIFVAGMVGTVSAATSTFYTVNNTDATLTRGATNASFTYLRAASSASSIGNAGYVGLKSDLTTDTFSEMYRSVYIFDTSALPDDATILSAVFGVYISSNLTTNGDCTVGLTKYNVDASLEEEDYNDFDGTWYTTPKNISAFMREEYTELPLNSVGLSNISLTGNTGFMYRSEWDIDNTTPLWTSGGGKTSRITTRTAENVTYIPYLTIEYRPADETPPYLFSIGNWTAYEGSPIKFTTISNSTNISITYSISGMPAGTNYTYTPLDPAYIYAPSTSGYSFIWTPNSTESGIYPITFTALNGTSSTSEIINITVKENCLFNATNPVGYTCRGDGQVYQKVPGALYGADADPSSEPLGGGVGYSDIIDPADADYTVTTRDELIAALAGATSGDIIYVDDDSEIDMLSNISITVPGNVTLASGRGVNQSLGALIYTNNLSDTRLFNIGSASHNIRITGLRIQGPDMERRIEQSEYLLAQEPSEYYDLPVLIGIECGGDNLTVDNTEFSGFSYAAINVGTSSSGNKIHHNFIHHNQRKNLGYGVVNGKGNTNTFPEVEIYSNVFDWNRHSIAGVSDTPGSSYEARYNFVLENANSHYFDMHGGDDVSDPAIPAGGNITIHHNTFMENVESHAAVNIRGIPAESAQVYRNLAMYDLDDYTVLEVFLQSMTHLPGHTPYENMTVYENCYNDTCEPVVSFTKSRNIVKIPQPVVFTDTSTNTPTNWTWDFGDG